MVWRVEEGGRKRKAETRVPKNSDIISKAKRTEINHDDAVR